VWESSVVDGGTAEPGPEGAIGTTSQAASAATKPKATKARDIIKIISLFRQQTNVADLYTQYVYLF
jgi:hypothetical protein